MVDIRAYNRDAWDRQVAQGNVWTVPVTADQVAAARRGEWDVYLTPTKSVPRAWFGDLNGARVLGLASGGGQQGPILAAAGAQVIILDNSPAQLAQDRRVAEREGLEIETVQGDMRDLSAFANDTFDLIFHPVANNFVPEIRPVWREAYRVLRPGGSLLSGFVNPVVYTFDWAVAEQEHRLEVRYSLPYAMVDHLSPDELAGYPEPLEFSHTLEDQIGGQIDAGFVLTGFYEDLDGPAEGGTVKDGTVEEDLLSQFMPTFIATRAVKLALP